MLTCSVETLERSLEAVMEAGKDITPFFYDRFFALYPEQRANFYHFESTSGNMVNEMITSVLALASNEAWRAEEHTSELQSLMRISYAVFCLKKNNNKLSSNYNTLY